ncbi:hypothetical protein KIN20_025405 [Parelaphostrongylus tenuis]|uniref:Uncharacterized protein n=1 Tax=Parelaphostrongylus tenuis TaxID=148309 RepID=A0AAD5QX82_PARTN|nr:hypothetical protein KIN20_025405 [Parelaphostrongylus tenuis]
MPSSKNVAFSNLVNDLFHDLIHARFRVSVLPSFNDTDINALKVCFCEDEENQTPVEFVKGGPFGDLIREIRRVLKIMNTDKVYGYFRRDFGEDKQLEINPKILQTPVDKIGITQDSLILVDITGIVNNKANKRLATSSKK